ncbi:hypothetical protein [Actinoplanes palleronii]|uniref:Uncharacterized protein n=1 Tax=Actinoplanes palleronii TaxID=113570 RepID=A0ABQ4BR61_9ACTN|nr:hypothetical protein [Actinoplanes palleronii]GIE73163.1 hypothetical protein Apa02nite_092710 [Actinoplanes palleronii]
MAVSERCRATGIAVGVGVGFALVRTIYFELAPVVLAVATVVGMLAGEAVSPRPARRSGGAGLRVRRMSDYVAAGDLVVIGLLAAGVAGFVASYHYVAGFTAFPQPDRPGHEVEYYGTAAPVTLVGTIATLGVVAVLAALAVWRVVRSPQLGLDEAEHAADGMWRQAAVRRIVHGCGAIFAVVLTSLAFWYADDQLDWRGAGSPPWGYTLSLLAAAGLVTFARFAGTLVTPPQEATGPAREEAAVRESAAAR